MPSSLIFLGFYSSPSLVFLSFFLMKKGKENLVILCVGPSFMKKICAGDSNFFNISDPSFCI